MQPRRSSRRTSSSGWGIDVEARLPDSIGRFQVLSLLGRGAMGVVYKGHDPHIGRAVAIKVIRTDLLAGPDRDTYLARFRDEARIIGLCGHPNIVGVHEFAFAGDQPYLVMEYIDGIPLNRAVARGTQLSMPEAAHIALHILDALNDAHASGIVHCDIKPANILLTRAARVKITDFGISRLAGTEPAGVPLMIGTPSYMSPEQCIGGAVDHRSDFFSLGAVLYELLTGERPFQGLAYTDTIFKLINQPHHPLTTLRPDLPVAVGALIDSAMAKKAEDRFPDVAHFTEALRAVPLEEDAPPILFGMRNLGGFALFDYATPTPLATGDRDEIDTVRLTTLPVGAPAEVDTPRPAAEIAPIMASALPLRETSVSSRAKRERNWLSTRRAKSAAAELRKSAHWRVSTIGGIVTRLTGSWQQREED
jgi:serine/threonine protein kinase